MTKSIINKTYQEERSCIVALFFDEPDKTFADLYMKSGMYITEIVTRLYQSSHMKQLYPDSAERLNHIFAKQDFAVGFVLVTDEAEA